MRVSCAPDSSALMAYTVTERTPAAMPSARASSSTRSACGSRIPSRNATSMRCILLLQLRAVGEQLARVRAPGVQQLDRREHGVVQAVDTHPEPGTGHLHQLADIARIAALRERHEDISLLPGAEGSGSDGDALPRGKEFDSEALAERFRRGDALFRKAVKERDALALEQPRGSSSLGSLIHSHRKDRNPGRHLQHREQGISPPSAALTGTPTTGWMSLLATTPGRCAARPAPAITSAYRSPASCSRLSR